MDASQPLSIESFSYSWLVNLKPSSSEILENSLAVSFDPCDEASSFIEMDPRMPPSKRLIIRNTSQDFKFDFPINSQSPLSLVHADELFSNGHVMPNMEAFEASDSALLPLPISSHGLKLAVQGSKQTNNRNCTKFSKRILQKYFDFLRPLYQRIRGRRRSSSRFSEGGSDPRADHVMSSRVYSAATSPRISLAYSVDNLRKSCDSESSIYEAVLHCKRSINN